MFVNRLSVAGLILAGAIGTAGAATLPVPPIGDFIYAHNAHAEFLPGAFQAGPFVSDDGVSSPPSPSPTQQGRSQPGSAGTEPPPATAPAPATAPVFAPSLSRLLETASSTSDQGGGGVAGTFGGGGPTGPTSGGPGTSVNVVPLPPALPMFGCALLAMAAVARGRKALLARR